MKQLKVKNEVEITILADELKKAIQNSTNTRII